ncbi:hypothetical protein COCNU_06G009700 [Cocos nucifera]|uniref:Uncharacterized protein n=1 Tax=Cocos nucifera TaxID=13894 RepID=A0A8K0IBD9_COCNU|nr:hypothetical protein COCNU_06G009700 [Cocos nucifera]
MSSSFSTFILIGPQFLLEGYSSSLLGFLPFIFFFLMASSKNTAGYRSSQTPSIRREIEGNPQNDTEEAMFERGHLDLGESSGDILGPLAKKSILLDANISRLRKYYYIPSWYRVMAPVNVVQALPVQSHAHNGEGSNQVEAEKGKVVEPPTFSTEYGPNTSSREATVMVGMRIKATDQALQDRRPTEELMKMVMLPADWEMAHDITILYVALNGFARLNFELENKAQTTNARAKVVGELLHATEEQEKKYQEKLAKLEAKLGISQNKSTNLEEEFG